MSSVWNKIDPGLATIYAEYLELREHGPSARAVHPVVEAGGRPIVFVHFTAELEELEALGFECAWREDEHRAKGTIDLADLERLAEHPGVHRILFGRERKLLLDKSVPDIRANKVWALAGGVFSGGTGAGAIVGIIDTGIDFRHEFFLASASPATTRIRRIWDQGLTPTGGEKSPDVGLLSGGPPTYGVEYTDDDINKVLRATSGAPPVRHRDCEGHGTHVASITAGDGRKAFKFVGVAPRADLVIVKHLDLETDPAGVGSAVLFRDAVSYILNVAGKPPVGPRPVVINYSIGTGLGPHDGFTDDEDWLTDKFKGATGRVFVAAAGNEGGVRQHARIELPAATEVEIPLELVDDRKKTEQFRGCQNVDVTDDLFVDLWYRSGGPTLSAKVDPPLLAVEFDAPALGDPVKSDTFGLLKKWEMEHSVESVTLRGARGTVTRNHLYLKIMPFRNSHSDGNYTLKLTSSGPGPLTVHLWCSQPGELRFKVGTPTSPHVFVEDKNLINDPGGAANILTVAAYDAETPPSRPIIDRSSRGPLVPVSGGGPQPSKPDLAAPGLGVDAAQSGHTLMPVPGDTVAKNGTSMSAPHVTGAVALMLAKKPTLTAADAASILRAQADKVPPVASEAGGAGRLDAEKAFNAVPP